MSIPHPLPSIRLLRRIVRPTVPQHGRLRRGVRPRPGPLLHVLCGLCPLLPLRGHMRLQRRLGVRRRRSWSRVRSVPPGIRLCGLWGSRRELLALDSRSTSWTTTISATSATSWTAIPSNVTTSPTSWTTTASTWTVAYHTTTAYNDPRDGRCVHFRRRAALFGLDQPVRLRVPLASNESLVHHHHHGLASDGYTSYGASRGPHGKCDSVHGSHFDRTGGGSSRRSKACLNAVCNIHIKKTTGRVISRTTIGGGESGEWGLGRSPRPIRPRKRRVVEAADSRQVCTFRS